MAYPAGVALRIVKTVALLDYTSGAPLRGFAYLSTEASPIWEATGDVLLARQSEPVPLVNGVATFPAQPVATQSGFVDESGPVSGWSSSITVVPANPDAEDVPVMTFVLEDGLSPLVVAPSVSGLRTAGITVTYVDVPILPGGVSLDVDGVPYYDPDGAPVLIDEDDVPYFIA